MIEEIFHHRFHYSKTTKVLLGCVRITFASHESEYLMTHLHSHLQFHYKNNNIKLKI